MARVTHAYDGEPSTLDKADLPDSMHEIADVIGVHGVLALQREKGGTEISLPAQPGPDHWLSQLLGFDAARRLCEHFAITTAGRVHSGRAGLSRLLIPLTRPQERRRRIEAALDAGLSVSATARETGVHRRTVSRYRARRKVTRK